MITLRISNWPDDTGLEHVSTSWQISDKTDFIIIMDEALESDVYLNSYRSSVEVPVGKEYYARSKRHFLNGSSTDWKGPIKILSTESGDNIDLKPEVVIEEPVVNIEDDTNRNVYIIKAGAFRCKTDGHKATSYILKDGLGNVLFRSIADTINKKEILINKEYLAITNSNVLIAEVSFISTNDYQSHFGSCRLELNKFNFEVVSNVNFIPINEDYIFEFRIINNAEHILNRYKVVDDNDKLIKEGTFLFKEERIIIEREKLEPKTTYSVLIYSDSLPNDVNITTFYTNNNESIYKVDKKYKYKEKYLETTMVGVELKRTMSEQFIDNGLPISSNLDGYVKLYHYNKRIETLTLSNLGMFFLQAETTGVEGVNVKVINTDLILIDANTGLDGKPEFKIYDYTYGKLIHTTLRADEESNASIANNLTVGSDGNVYYFANVNSTIVFRVFNTKDYTIKDLAVRPDLKDTTANLVYVGNDRIMSFNGSLNKALVYLYDISEDSWYDVTIVPERYRTLTMTSFLRKDGKVISFNTGNDTNDVLLFDPTDNSIVVIENDLDDTIDLDSTIRLRDGEFLRYDSRQPNPVLYRYI